MIIKKLTKFINENKNHKLYNRIIDYTNLTTLTNDDIKKLCKQAEDEMFYSVCVLPEFVSIVSSFFTDSDVKIVTAIDFPKGESSITDKIKEVEKAIVNGVDEIDVVINYSLLKKKDYEELENEIRTITEYVHKEGKIIKTIIEIGILNFQELEKICEICVESNVDYIMTSTGKLPNDDSFEKKLEKVKFIRKIIPNDTKIKFSGGIRSNDQIKQLANYCDRIGTSTFNLS